MPRILLGYVAAIAFAGIGYFAAQPSDAAARPYVEPTPEPVVVAAAAPVAPTPAAPTPAPAPAAPAPAPQGG